MTLSACVFFSGFLHPSQFLACLFDIYFICAYVRIQSMAMCTAKKPGVATRALVSMNVGEGKGYDMLYL